MHLKNSFKQVALSCCLIAISQFADAQALKFDGFINVVGNYTDSPSVYLSSITNEPNFSEDSNLGFRFSSQITDRFNVTGLLVGSSDETSDGLTADFKNAFIRYKVSNSINIFAGRLLTPLWLISDYRYVGNLYPWVRPPVEVYKIIDIDTTDGIAADLKTKLFGHFFRLKVLYGKAQYERQRPSYKSTTSNTLTRTESVDGHIYNIITELYTYNYLVRLAYSEGKADAEIKIDSVGASTVQSTVKYILPHLRYRFFSGGIKVNHEAIFAIGEYANLVTEFDANDSDLTNAKGQYLTIGFQNDYITPSLTYAHYRVNSAQNSLLGVSEESRTEFDSWTIGVQKDFTGNVTAKAQWKHMNNIEKSSNSSPSIFFDSINKLDKAANIISVSLSALF